LPSPVITPSPTPKTPPPTVGELVALWQENIESDIRDKVFSSRWRRLPAETRYQVLPRLIINYYEVILYCPIRNKEQFYLDAMLVQARSSTWFQLMINTRPRPNTPSRFAGEQGRFWLRRDNRSLALAFRLVCFTEFRLLRLIGGNFSNGWLPRASGTLALRLVRTDI